MQEKFHRNGILNGVAATIGAGVHYLQIMIKMASKILLGNGISKRPMISTT
jgi:hypothetical protein